MSSDRFQGSNAVSSSSPGSPPHSVERANVYDMNERAEKQSSTRQRASAAEAQGRSGSFYRDYLSTGEVQDDEKGGMTITSLTAKVKSWWRGSQAEQERGFSRIFPNVGRDSSRSNDSAAENTPLMVSGYPYSAAPFSMQPAIQAQEKSWLDSKALLWTLVAASVLSLVVVADLLGEWGLLKALGPSEPSKLKKVVQTITRIDSNPGPFNPFGVFFGLVVVSVAAQFVLSSSALICVAAWSWCAVGGLIIKRFSGR